MDTENKIDRILEMLNEQKVILAETVVYQKTHAKKLEEHTEKHKEIDGKIQELTDYKNQLIGKNSIVALVFGGIGAVITFVIKHLST